MRSMKLDPWKDIRLTSFFLDEFNNRLASEIQVQNVIFFRNHKLAGETCSPLIGYFNCAGFRNGFVLLDL